MRKEFNYINYTVRGTVDPNLVETFYNILGYVAKHKPKALNINFCSNGGSMGATLNICAIVKQIGTLVDKLSVTGYSYVASGGLDIFLAFPNRTALNGTQFIHHCGRFVGTAEKDEFIEDLKDGITELKTWEAKRNLKLLKLTKQEKLEYKSGVNITWNTESQLKRRGVITTSLIK